MRMNTNQTLNLPAVARFLSSKESNFLFLALAFLVAVILVVFVQPLGVLDYTTQSSALSPLAQVALMAAGGYALVFLSRMILIVISSRMELAPPLLVIWMFVELVLCVAVTVIMAWSLSGAGAIQLAPLAGDVLLGNISVFLVPNVIAFLSFRLREMRDELEMLRSQLPSESQIPPSDLTINFYDKGGRLALSTRSANVLFIEAADNYANIHYLNEGKEDTFILHNSLKDIEKGYSGMGLMRCHRGYMVNLANVKLMRKEKTGFILELNNSVRTLPVSKSYAAAVTRHFAGTMPPSS